MSIKYETIKYFLVGETFQLRGAPGEAENLFGPQRGGNAIHFGRFYKCQ